MGNTFHLLAILHPRLFEGKKTQIFDGLVNEV